MPENRKQKLIAQNKKATHDYFIEEVFQAGIELFGTEVKSMRAGRCNLKDSYVEVKQNQAYVVNMHVSPYEQGNIYNKDPMRKRRLLLHKNEIRKLSFSAAKEGLTVVPLKVYFDGCYVKLDIALAKGKKLYDKRDTVAKKDSQREIEREIKGRQRSRGED